MTDRQTPDAATRVVGVTALLVAAFLFVAILVGTISTIIVSVVYSGPSDYTYTTTLVQGIFEQLFTVVLPAAVGVFVGFRVIAPISADLSLRRVLLRGLVTAGIVALLTFVVAIFVIIATTVTNNIFGNSFPLQQFGGAFAQAFASIPTILSTFLDRLPLVVLAGVLLWLWLGAKRRGSGV